MAMAACVSRDNVAFAALARKIGARRRRQATDRINNYQIDWPTGLVANCQAGTRIAILGLCCKPQRRWSRKATA